MSKSVTLEHLRNAKKAHIQWVQRAKSLTEGIEVKKEQIPVESTACAFGQWFYGQGQDIGLMPGMDAFKMIEELHTQLHDMYRKIFKVYYDDSERSLFAKLLNLKKRVSSAEQDAAIGYFNQLEAISKQLLESITRLERRIAALPETAFE